MSEPLCAACGMPAHRYSTNDYPRKFDPQSCINGLLTENERLRGEARATEERLLFEAERLGTDLAAARAERGETACQADIWQRAFHQSEEKRASLEGALRSISEDASFSAASARAVARDALDAEAHGLIVATRKAEGARDELKSAIAGARCPNCGTWARDMPQLRAALTTQPEGKVRARMDETPTTAEEQAEWVSHTQEYIDKTGIGRPEPHGPFWPFALLRLVADLAAARAEVEEARNVATNMTREYADRALTLALEGAQLTEKGLRSQLEAAHAYSEAREAEVERLREGLATAVREHGYWHPGCTVWPNPTVDALLAQPDTTQEGEK